MFFLPAQLGFRHGSRGLSTSRVIEKVTTDSEVNLDSERAAVYGSPCMELGLQPLDRIEMQLVGKECARGVSCQRRVIQEQ